jgi:hypothetical protein
MSFYLLFVIFENVYVVAKKKPPVQWGLLKLDKVKNFNKLLQNLANSD